MWIYALCGWCWGAGVDWGAERTITESTSQVPTTYYVYHVMALHSNCPGWVILSPFYRWRHRNSFQPYSPCFWFKHSINQNNSHNHIMQSFTELDVRHWVKLYFPNEENEAQGGTNHLPRGEVTYTGYVTQWQSQDSNPGLTPTFWYLLER